MLGRSQSGKSGAACTSLAAALAGAAALAASNPTQALTIQLVDGGGAAVGTDAYNGFLAASQLWTAVLKDDVTIRLTVGFNSSLGSNVLGQSSTSNASFSYDAVRNALVNDKLSAADASAVANLQSTSSLKLLTTNATGGVIYDANGSANNMSVAMTTANAKALRLLTDNGSADASILFNSSFSFDFNRTDGIQGFDFIGIAAHEIGHALGFISGVDFVDYYAHLGMSTDGYIYVEPLDLLRYSAKSLSYGAGVIDLAAGDASYFSVDGGTTDLANFSTGSYLGDGWQASHWKLGTGGVMDPAVGSGQMINPTSLDYQAMDAIGWDLTVSGTPYPSGSTGGSTGGGGKGGGSGNGKKSNPPGKGGREGALNDEVFDVPEPSSLLVVLIGAAVVAPMAKRRRLRP